MSGGAPQAVDGHPGWFWWRGVHGVLYARRVRSSPPRVVRARDWTALLDRIRAAERPPG